MSLSLGSTTIGSLYLGSTKVSEAYLGSTKVFSDGAPDPYNPLGLPPFTIRCKFTAGTTPTMGDSQTLVDATDNVWDITSVKTKWARMFRANGTLIEVLGANTRSVTDMSSMFHQCISVTKVPVFNTSSVTNMQQMFYRCAITSIPLFDTKNVTNVSQMFRDATNVESGALALYQQMSTQATPPSSYAYCFTNCGSNTTTGAAERAQIPTSWGGTGA